MTIDYESEAHEADKKTNKYRQGFKALFIFLKIMFVYERKY